MHTIDKKIAVIGLGYVGLPLAVEFGKFMAVLWFDINQSRVGELKAGKDGMLAVTPEDLRTATYLAISCDPSNLHKCYIFIVTVPIPIDGAYRPDLTSLLRASEAVDRALKSGVIVIYESTVYARCTEEVCVPVLEQHSGLNFNEGLFCGYSPERINPGDKEHRPPTIKKVTSGSTPEVADTVDQLYGQIITAGAYKASSIKVAEAAKVIENTKRDLNIALMNELSLIFHKLVIDTLEVLQAVGMKWNFLPLRPGLVGGHCIGVDPYYRTHKAQEVCYHPEVILAGRRINDGMAHHVADETIKLMQRKGLSVLGSKLLVLGLTFRENCPDVRNTKMVDVVIALRGYSTQVDVYDPWVDIQKAEHEYGLQCLAQAPTPGQYASLVLAVGYHQFLSLGEKGIKAWGQSGAVVYDVKSVLPLGAADGRL